MSEEDEGRRQALERCKEEAEFMIGWEFTLVLPCTDSFDLMHRKKAEEVINEIIRAYYGFYDTIQDVTYPTKSKIRM